MVLSTVAALSGGAGAEELYGKEKILDSLLGPSRSIGKQQRRAVDLPTVTFEFNSASLTPQGRQQLEILAQALKEGQPDRSQDHDPGPYRRPRRRRVQHGPVGAASARRQGIPGQRRRHRAVAADGRGSGQDQAAARQARFAPEQRRIEVVVGAQ